VGMWLAPPGSPTPSLSQSFFSFLPNVLSPPSILAVTSSRNSSGADKQCAWATKLSALDPVYPFPLFPRLSIPPPLPGRPLHPSTLLSLCTPPDMSPLLSFLPVLASPRTALALTSSVPWPPSCRLISGPPPMWRLWSPP
jgi:hypothetical protein